MTSIQLAQRLARNLKVTDLASYGAMDMLELLAAMNAGIQTVWRTLPPKFRTTTVSALLAAPVAVGVTVDGLLSSTLTTDAFTEAQRGGTVRVSDDPRDNEVTGTRNLRDPFLGATLAGTATVYSDARQIYDVVERIVSDVRCYKADGTYLALARIEPAAGALHGLRQSGVPATYSLEAVGVDQLGDSQFVLRVYPLPDAHYIIRFEAETGPRAIGFANLLTSAVDVPVKDEFCHSALIPICEEELLRSPLWGDRKTAGLTTAAADRARAMLRNRAGDIGLPTNTLGTPAGY